MGMAIMIDRENAGSAVAPMIVWIRNTDLYVPNVVLYPEQKLPKLTTRSRHV
jgi:hypothetical protein